MVLKYFQFFLTMWYIYLLCLVISLYVISILLMPHLLCPFNQLFASPAHHCFSFWSFIPIAISSSPTSLMVWKPHKIRMGNPRSFHDFMNERAWGIYELISRACREARPSQRRASVQRLRVLRSVSTFHDFMSLGYSQTVRSRINKYILPELSLNK